MYSVFSDIRTIGDFFRSLKWAWQRATKGYCELDTYSVGDWLLNTLPDICEAINKKRCGYPSALFYEAVEHYGLKSMDEYNSAPEEIRDKVDDYGDKKWGEILSRLTFLLREANEDTCTKVNPYDEEYTRISKEFCEKYGEWGEKLLTVEEKAEAKTGSHPVYLPQHMPEYKEICELHSEEERKLNAYREQCKNEAFGAVLKVVLQLGILIGGKMTHREELWKRAERLLFEFYGETPDIQIVNRFLSEKRFLAKNTEENMNNLIDA